MVTKKIILTVLLAGGLFGAFQATAMGAGEDFLRNIEEKAERELAIGGYKAKLTEEKRQYQAWLRKQGERVNPSKKNLRGLRLKAMIDQYNRQISDAEQRIEELDKLLGY